jgi:hypothetical protein
MSADPTLSVYMAEIAGPLSDDDRRLFDYVDEIAGHLPVEQRRAYFREYMLKTNDQRGLRLLLTAQLDHDRRKELN